MYRKVLNIDVQIHTGATANVSECPMLQSRLFDYEHYRWGDRLFYRKVLEGVRNIKPKIFLRFRMNSHKIASKADFISENSYPPRFSISEYHDTQRHSEAD